MTTGWTLQDAPRLDGKIAIVTGPTSGIGYWTAFGLAQLGAETILAGRDERRCDQAMARICQALPAAKLQVRRLDLASLASVAAFAETVRGPIDVLVNNAGIMGLPRRAVTEDGFERQIGVNYLGHFALTARLKSALCAAPGGGRVVNVASVAHRRVTLNMGHFPAERSYEPRTVYGRTKLAMLMFSLELHRRATASDWPLRSIACHPGWARTEIVRNGMGRGLKGRLADFVFNRVAQPAREGALPSLYAAAAPEAASGGYYGPSGWRETRGPPGPAGIFPQALDEGVARDLWALSERLTRVPFG
jgi:NAD(P)-dependent dehydrogenase (short-subunit alcohol dehydrogenase family)